MKNLLKRLSEWWAKRKPAPAVVPPKTDPAPGPVVITTKFPAVPSVTKTWFLERGILGKHDRTLLYLAKDVTEAQRAKCRAKLQAAGANSIVIMTSSTLPHEPLSLYSNGKFGGAVDETEGVRWRVMLQDLLRAGLTPVVWHFPDDHSGINRGASVDKHREHIQTCGRFFSGLPVMVVPSIETSEWTDASYCRTMVGWLRSSYPGMPVAVHSQIGTGDWVGCLKAGDIAAFEATWNPAAGDSHNPAEVASAVADVARRTGKPVVAAEYNFLSAKSRAQGQAALSAGAVGAWSGC